MILDHSPKPELDEDEEGKKIFLYNYEFLEHNIYSNIINGVYGNVTQLRTFLLCSK